MLVIMDTVKFFEEIKEKIASVGGLMYQYRSCAERNKIIYDIENIRHGVIFSQSPLNMNDPFDSQIAFVPDDIYDEITDYVLQAIKIDSELIPLCKMAIKCKLQKENLPLINDIKNIKRLILSVRKSMHNNHLRLDIFLRRFFDNVYKRMPNEIKTSYSKTQLKFISQIIIEIAGDLTTENIEEVLYCKCQLDSIVKQIEDLRDTIYIPNYEKFLNKIKVSCFSASGWDNQLMWAHYANSYKGICIEYDFNNYTSEMGIMREVRYDTKRPFLSLHNLGIQGVKVDESSTKFVAVTTPKNDDEIVEVVDKLLVKNMPWEYEHEWRLINVTKSESSPFLFVNMPYIKSITLGIRIDALIKELLWDVCQEKGIDCYQLEVSKNDYSLSRRLLKNDDFIYTQTDISYINYLVEQIIAKTKEVQKLFETKISNANLFFKYLEFLIDVLSDAYFLKKALTKISQENLEEEKKEFDLLSQTLIDTSENISDVCNKNIRELLNNGNLSLKQYISINAQLTKIAELVECLKNNKDSN